VNAELLTNVAYLLGVVCVPWPAYQWMQGWSQRETPALWASGDRGVGASIVVACVAAIFWPLFLLGIPFVASMWIWRGRTFPWSPKPAAAPPKRVNR